MLSVKKIKTKSKKKKIRLNKNIENEHPEKKEPANDLQPPLPTRFLN